MVRLQAAGRCSLRADAGLLAECCGCCRVLLAAAITASLSFRAQRGIATVR